jgi:hypothetical protein
MVSFKNPVRWWAGSNSGLVCVFLGRRILEGRERAVWFFEREPDHGGNRDVLRRLRINVTRLHAALSSLRILSDLRLKGKLALKSEAAQTRLKDCLSTYLPILYRRESLGFLSSDFLAAALSMAETLRPQEFTTLRTLHPAPGRGLRDQLERADAAVRRVQPTEPPPLEWDVFLAHAGADRDVAEQLFALLDPPARVFLDSKRLVPGDDWDLILPGPGAIVHDRGAAGGIAGNGVLSAVGDRIGHLALPD